MKNGKTLKKLITCSLLMSLCAAPVWAASMHSFSLQNLKGEGKINSEQYKGKVMIVDFWASWCGPCKASFAAYNELLKKYGSSGLVIIGINIDNDPSKAKEFLEENPASFYIASDPDKRVAGTYNLPTMPTAYIIGRDGNILNTHPGYHEGDLAAMEKEVATALGGSQGKDQAPAALGESQDKEQAPEQETE